MSIVAKVFPQPSFSNNYSIEEYQKLYDCDDYSIFIDDNTIYFLQKWRNTWVGEKFQIQSDQKCIGHSFENGELLFFTTKTVSTENYTEEEKLFCLSDINQKEVTHVYFYRFKYCPDYNKILQSCMSCDLLYFSKESNTWFLIFEKGNPFSEEIHIIMAIKDMKIKIIHQISIKQAFEETFSVEDIDGVPHYIIKTKNAFEQEVSKSSYILEFSSD